MPIVQALQRAYPQYTFYSPGQSVALRQVDLNKPDAGGDFYVSLHGEFTLRDASILPEGRKISIPSIEALSNGEIAYIAEAGGRYVARWKGEAEKPRKPSKMAFLNRGQTQQPADWGPCESLPLTYVGPPGLSEVNENFFLWFSQMQHTSTSWNDNDNTLSIAVVTIHDLRALGKIKKPK